MTWMPLRKKYLISKKLSNKSIESQEIATQSCESENKEIGLIVDELKKGNKEYEQKNEVLRSEKEKYKEKVDAAPSFLEGLSNKYSLLSNKMGSAEIKKDLDQFVKTLGAF